MQGKHAAHPHLRVLIVAARKERGSGCIRDGRAGQKYKNTGRAKLAAV